MKKYISFFDARNIIRGKAFKNSDEYREYSKQERPEFIPSAPNEVYKDCGWISWQDWLGNDNEKYGRKYCVKSDFFSVWSSNMAYVLGFWWADGNIQQRKKNSYRFSICQKEKTILEDISRAFESTYPIYEYKVKKYPANIYYLIRVDDQVFIKGLMDLGGIVKKSKTCIMPKIPEVYFRDFARGYFDGDGSIFVSRKNLVVDISSGSKKFIKSLSKNIEKTANIKNHIYSENDGKLWRIKIFGKEAISFCKYIYCDGSIKLERKYNVFKKYLEKT